MRRRDLLKLGGGAVLLAACGTSTPPPTSAPTAPTAATAAATAVPASTAAPASAAPAGTSAAPLPSAPAASSTGATPAATRSAGTAAAGPTPTRVVKPGGQLRDSSIADGATLHPYKSTDAASAAYASQVHGVPLLQRDPDTLDFIPYAAESWTLSEDKLTYTFKLRGDLVFSDGHPLTADDYAWTFGQANNPDNKYPYRSQLDQIASYTAPDPKTLVVKVKEPIAPGLERAVGAVSSPLPRHVWERLDWNDPTRNPEILKPTVGAAEWKLLEWVKDDHITFAANDKYFRGRPNFDTYSLRIVPNPTVEFQMFKNGELDLLSPQPSDYKEAKALPIADMYEWQPAAPSWTYIGFNLRRDHVEDVQVRRALSYAVDRQGIIDSVVEGLAKPIYSTYPPTHWVYNPDVARYDYDMNKAKQALKDAGYAPGADGILRKDGKPLELKLLFGPNSNKVREQIAAIVQQSFKQLGVAVEVTGMEFNAFLAALKNDQTEWDMTVLGWTGTLEPDAMRAIWLASSIPDLNFVRYQNQRVEDLFLEGQREFDREKRKAIYGQIQKIISDDAPYVFLYYNLGYAAVNKRIGGVRATPLGITGNDGILSWYVK